MPLSPLQASTARITSARGVRPLKTQQKVSGRLASDDVTQDRLDIRGYIDTARKHGKNDMDVLYDLMLGRPWRPSTQAPSPQTGVKTALRPFADDFVLLASELSTNAIVHSRSGLPGGVFTVRAEVRAGEYAWLEVEDEGGPWLDKGPDEEHGRGLALGNTLSADAGANLRELMELMERMGHSSTRAALVYLHSTTERQHVIADAVGKAAKAALRKSKKAQTASGTEVARPRGRAL